MAAEGAQKSAPKVPGIQKVSFVLGVRDGSGESRLRLLLWGSLIFFRATYLVRKLSVCCQPCFLRSSLTIGYEFLGFKEKDCFDAVC